MVQHQQRRKCLGPLCPKPLHYSRQAKQQLRQLPLPVKSAAVSPSLQPLRRRARPIAADEALPTVESSMGGSRRTFEQKVERLRAVSAAAKQRSEEGGAGH